MHKNGIAIAIAQCGVPCCSPRVQLGDDAVIVIVVCQHGVIETIVLYCYWAEIKTEAKEHTMKKIRGYVIFLKIFFQSCTALGGCMVHRKPQFMIHHHAPCNPTHLPTVLPREGGARGYRFSY